MSEGRIQLKPKHDRRLRAGHPWVFSNEVAEGLKEIEPGSVVNVFDAKGAFVGRGYANPNSLICVRLMSRRRQEDLNHAAFIADRLRMALALRDVVCPDRRCRRVVHGEADGLSGLTVDQYGDVLVVQLDAVAWEQRRELLAEALRSVFEPAGVVLHNDGRFRSQEDLPSEHGLWFGEVPDTMVAEEQGTLSAIRLLDGPKVGRYTLAQADNRTFAAEVSRGRSILDVYAGGGTWAIRGLMAGATEALIVDKHEGNAQLACENAEINGVGDRVEAWAGEGRKAMQELVGEGRRFGCVVLDPPPFAKNKRAANSALKGYEDTHTLAMTLTEPGGFLFTTTRSQAVLTDRFFDSLGKAARSAGRSLRLVRQTGAGVDFPVLPTMAQSAPLRHFVFQVHMGV